jgi:hypothetical protein
MKVQKLILLVSFAFWAGGIALYSCTRVNAAPRPAPVALAESCIDTAGTYTPVAISRTNAGAVFFNPAHFMRICNEVYVSGSLAGSDSFDTLQASLVQVSIPFASDLSGQNAYGQALIGFNGSLQPTMGNIGFVHLVGATGAVISWQPQKKNAYGLIYSFSYTIQ